MAATAVAMAATAVEEAAVRLVAMAASSPLRR